MKSQDIINEFDIDLTEGLEDLIESPKSKIPTKKKKKEEKTGVNTKDTGELLQFVIVNLAEFADIEYAKQLLFLVENSEYNHLNSILKKVIRYREENGIFPSKQYWEKKWGAEKVSEEWLPEYSHEIIAKLRTEIVYNEISETMKGKPSQDLIKQIQASILRYTPEKVNDSFKDGDNLANSLREAQKRKKTRGAGLLTGTSIDKYTMGCPFGGTTVIGAMPKTGKQLINGTKIITPGGLVNIEKLRVGDIVTGMDGLPTRVTGVFPQGVQDLYTIKFCDGTTEICGKEHLWLVHTREDRRFNRAWRVLNTETIMQKVKVSDGIGKQRSYYSIPFVEPIQYTVSERLYIHPYIIGCLLGDGQLSNNSSVRLTSIDKDIIDSFKAKLPKEYTLSQQKKWKRLYHNTSSKSYTIF